MKLRFSVSRWRRRTEQISPSLPGLNQLPQDRRNQVLAVCSELLQKSEQLQSSLSQLQQQRSAPAAAVLIPTLTYLQSRLYGMQAKTKAFKDLVKRIEGETFYWEVILWFVLPSEYGEALVGDLNEEYVLLCSTEGETAAREWYLRQASGIEGLPVEQS